MGPARASPNNLRNHLHDRSRDRSRVERFLDERHERDRLHGSITSSVTITAEPTTRESVTIDCADNNLRNRLPDRSRDRSRVVLFLDERRERDHNGRNGRNDREREDASHRRPAQQLRYGRQIMFRDYLQTLATDLDSISTQLQALDLQDGDYQERSAYKYGRPATPSFTGSEATFIDFVRATSTPAIAGIGDFPQCCEMPSSPTTMPPVLGASTVFRT